VLLPVAYVTSKRFLGAVPAVRLLALEVFSLLPLHVTMQPWNAYLPLILKLTCNPIRVSVVLSWNA